jgi:hypothetical protein
MEMILQDLKDQIKNEKLIWGEQFDFNAKTFSKGGKGVLISVAQAEAIVEFLEQNQHIFTGKVSL